MSTSPDAPGRSAASRKGAAARPGAAASPEARRLAAVILEVLAGLRGPAEAATACGVSLPRYYACEQRALHGLLEACEPRKRGRQPSVEGELARLKRQCQLLQRQCDRQQALLRLAQRSIGLAPAAPPARGTAAGKPAARKRRRPRTRVLKVISALRQVEAADGPPVCPKGNDVPC
jgi:hypothetical protein